MRFWTCVRERLGSIIGLTPDILTFTVVSIESLQMAVVIIITP
jgi:hypothetical protein